MLSSLSVRTFSQMMAKDGQSPADDSLTGKQRTKQTPVNKVDVFVFFKCSCGYLLKLQTGLDEVHNYSKSVTLVHR